MARNDQRSIPLTLLLVAAALLIARIAFQVTKDEPPVRVQWVTLEEGVALARGSGRPLLLDFTADWCAPCHQLDAEVFADPALAARINERFVSVRLTDRQKEQGRNAPAVAALQRRYAVNVFPTVVFAATDGTELARLEGFSGRKQFVQVMEQVR